MSKDYTFNPGDFVVYPAQGVGKVIGIGTKPIAGQNLHCITVGFGINGDKSTINIPSSKALDNGLRQIATPVMMESVEKVLSKKPKSKYGTWNRRSVECNAKINSGSPIALAEVLRELHNDIKSTCNKRQVYEKAMALLAPEYAVVKNITPDEAKTAIEGFLQGPVSAE